MEFTNEELVQMLQAGNTDALGPLWEQVHRLAYQCAFRFFNRQRAACASSGVELEDVQQESFFAVLDTARAFDPAKGWKFTSWLQYPMKNRFNALIGFRGHTAPRPLDSALSLDEPISEEDEGITLADALGDPAAADAFENAEQATYNDELHIAMQEALDTLESFQRDTITARYYDGMTPIQAATALQITAQDVRRTEKQAMQRLRSGRAFSLLSPFTVDYDRAYSGTGFQIWKNCGSIEERLIEHDEVKPSA